jgi:hypothetical protein
LSQEKDTLLNVIGKQRNCEFSLRFILQKDEAQWKLCFVLLKLIKKGKRKEIEYNYGDYVVAERILSINEGLEIIDGLFSENGERKLVIPDFDEFNVHRGQKIQFVASKVNYGYLFDDWPMRFCYFSVVDKQGDYREAELLKEKMPYYPSLNEAIIDFFELTTEHFSSYGQVYVVINDYRGRIKYLKLVFSKAKPILDLPELERENVVLKAFAQSGSRRVALKDIYPQNDDVEIDIGFNPESLYVALLSKDDNVKLDGKEFGTWRGEKGIIIERPKEEILFLTRAGESQTLEYKGDIVDENNKNDFIETIVAFSNTNRGVILVGVSDSGGILGTEKKAEDFERLIHDCCDPPPNNVKVEEADMPDKKHIIVVEVPLGENRPYQSKRDKNFYVRHNANDMRMERSELISMLEEINRERDQF